ncbi:unnamed protein product [Kluyveromyces dobzhanskii CBS 2104]|uniref:WGS project CCBQ000000000 data, contig MAT n=1 Tax=Kluyveromyces dobzhanskii CBS 2104 TaxID=1427455 RepID=A0A0A8L3H2_9SACH|nr:unnamed protein product [Kluyveromyces dobzhanskii CBS 2104]
MRIFQRKGNDGGLEKPVDLIPCSTFIPDPPQRYTKPSEQLELDDSKQTIYNSVQEHFSDSQLHLPVNGHADDVNNSDSYSILGEWEKFWLSKECILRHLRASAWNTEQAIKSLHDTLLWRRQFGLSEYSSIRELAQSVSAENNTGKISLLGYDRKSQLVLILKNGYQNTEPSFEQIRLLVWFLEVASILAPKGTESWTLLIDLKNYTDSNGVCSTYHHPPLSLAKQVINIIQDHYPERLYKCLVYGVPNSMWTFLKQLHPLIDPVPREKIHYDQHVQHHIESDQLGAEYGGRLDFKYTHSTYWPHLVETIERRIALQFENYERLGTKVGISEYKLK